VVATLALGIGANTALFGVFRSVFMTPLSFDEPDRLAFVMEAPNGGCCGPASGPDYLDWRERQRTFEEIGAISHILATLTGEGEAERLPAADVTASVFEVLRADAALGRLITEDDQLDPSVVLLSHGLWQTRFGGSQDVLGETLNVNGQPLTIIGVTAEGFDLLSPWTISGDFALYRPFSDERLLENRGMHGYPVVARLAPGSTLDDADSDMKRIMRELEVEYPFENEGRSARVFSAHTYLFGDVGKTLGFILGAAGLVLLIACGNVAGLQLARTAGRETELTLRSALGASRASVARLLFSESLLLAVVGGVLGLLVAAGGLEGIRSILPPTIPRAGEIRLDRWVLAFAGGIAAVTALAFGVVPALLASRADLAAGLREGGYATLAPRKERLRDYFIVGQIALGLVLANGAGLLVRSYVTLRGEETGFEAEGMLTLQTMAAGPSYPEQSDRVAYFDHLVTEASAISGVEHAGVVTKLPLNGGNNSYVQVEGQAPRSNDNQGPLVEMSFISGDYFDAAGIDLLAGRTLQPDDSISTAVGAVVNETMANRVWPGESAIGKRFTAEDDPPNWITVVGVVEDVRQWGLEDVPENEAYLPMTESWTPAGYLTIRTAGDAAAVAPAARSAVLAVDPSIPPSDVQTMRARVEEAFAQRRFTTTLIALFAAAALLMATAGIYGTVAYYVARRTRELGVRMALGAGNSGILLLVLRRGARLALWGVFIGLAGVWASTRLVERLLYGVAPLDLVSIMTGAIALALVTIGASTLPAVRALGVPPSLALRSD
jgi:predicted permease